MAGGDVVSRFLSTKSYRVAKKAMQAGPSGKRPSSAGSSGSGRMAMNIKQKVVLSNEQQQVLQLVVGEVKNIFFTGSAGERDHILPLGY